MTPRAIFMCLLACLVNAGSLTQAEANKNLSRADEFFENSPIDELSIEQIVELLK